MSRAIQLRVAPATSSTLRLTVSDGLTRPAEAEIPTSVLVGLAVIPPATGPILRAGRDAEWTRAEDAVSRQIASALARGGPAWAHLQVLRGRAEASRQMTTVVVDAAGEVASQVPWELLSLGEAALEGVEGGFVARLGSSSARQAPLAPSPTACVWTAGQDEISARLTAHLRDRCRAAGLSMVDLADRPSLLWVVAHGERAFDAVEIATADGSKGAGAVSARLAGAIPQASAVILAVCHAGSPSPDPLAVLSGRLLAAGAGAVITPVTSVPVELLHHFADGLLSAVSEGHPLGACVAAGRRAVRGWAKPHALARWSQLQCWVSSVDQLQVVLHPRQFRPPGWPRPDAEAGDWLEAARREAIRRADGYVGVEHLLRELARRDGGGAMAAALRRAAPRWLEAYDRCAASLIPQHTELSQHRSVAEPEVTPRLLSFGPQLPDGFGVELLAARLGALGRLVPHETPIVETVDTIADEGGPATDLEVHGGPEDGRRLRLSEHLRPGAECIIGRAGGQASLRLYEHTRLTDPKLSRRHLRWEGPGRAFALQLVRIRRAGAPAAVPVTGHFEISVGDELSLPEGTRLVGVAD